MNENKMFDQSPIDMLENDFKKIIVSIKEEIVNTQIKIAMQSNRSLIQLYFRIGKILYDNYEYGNKFIDQIAQELKLEYPNSTDYSVRNLKYMKKIYIEYKDDELMQQLVAQGLLLCKEKDKLSVEWSLQGIDLPIGVSSYQLNQYVAQNIVDKLPTEEEINLHIDMGSGDVHE